MQFDSIQFIMRASNYDHTAKKSIRYNLLSIFDITVQCHICGHFNNKNSHKFCRHFSKAWNKLDLLLGQLIFVAHSTAARIELGFNVLFDFNSENWIKESKLKYIYFGSCAIFWWYEPKRLDWKFLKLCFTRRTNFVTFVSLHFSSCVWFWSSIS